MHDIPDISRNYIGVVIRVVILALSFLSCGLRVVNAASLANYDIVIIGGRVMDPETGLDKNGMNVGINGRTIAVVTAEPITGKTSINAAGLVVSPGFIDILSYDPNGYGAWYKVADGVTTNLAMHGGAVEPIKWYKKFERATPVNFGAGFFYNSARLSIGVNPYRSATTKEIERLVAKAEEALDQGELGLGMSLEYAPGTSVDEVEAMMIVARRFNVPIFFHVRYSTMEAPGTNIDALNEVIALAKKTGASIHVDHINSTGGTFSMAASLGLIKKAVEDGVDITACTYPYPFWATYLNSARFDDGWQKRFRITYGDLQIGGTTERLTEESFARYRKAGKLAVAYAIPEDDVTGAVSSPFVMIGSDGIMEPGNNNHPRSAGTFARALRVYVRENKTITLMEAINKMSLMPAKRLEPASAQMRKKGRLQPGMDADIVIFNPDTVTDTATVERPNSFSKGFEYVIVNGKIVKDPKGLRKKTRPGQGIRTERSGKSHGYEQAVAGMDEIGR
ncbi:MAG: amidohydrolase family protein [Deltaproteobacteria bacterium]|nr:amidohydrolase family protein [Deltaproteobacteria bacterium]